MNKLLKILLVFTFSIVFFASCDSKNEIDSPIAYPKIYEIDYSNMETYKAHIIKDNIKYNYTFYFENDECLNAQVMVEFENSEEANKFYNTINESDLYANINIDNSIVTYYHNTENFEYMLYPKLALIDMLEKDDYILE